MVAQEPHRISTFLNSMTEKERTELNKKLSRMEKLLEDAQAALKILQEEKEKLSSKLEQAFAEIARLNKVIFQITKKDEDV